MGARAELIERLIAYADRRASRASRWIDDWSPRERRLRFDLADVAARVGETRIQLRELVALTEALA